MSVHVELKTKNVSRARLQHQQLLAAKNMKIGPIKRSDQPIDALQLDFCAKVEVEHQGKIYELFIQRRLCTATILLCQSLPF